MKRRMFISMAVGAVGALLAPSLSESLDTRPENQHRDFAPCHRCGTKTSDYHKPDCPRAAIPAGEERFYKSLQGRLIKLMKRTGKSVEWFMVEPERAGFRFVRVWVEGESAPYTWNHPC